MDFTTFEWIKDVATILFDMLYLGTSQLTNQVQWTNMEICWKRKGSNIRVGQLIFTISTLLLVMQFQMNSISWPWNSHIKILIGKRMHLLLRIPMALTRKIHPLEVLFSFTMNCFMCMDFQQLIIKYGLKSPSTYSKLWLHLIVWDWILQLN